MIYGLWDTKPFPDYMKKHILEWQKQGWTSLKIWNRQMCEDFLQQISFNSYDWFYLYQMLPRPVQRADLLRYLIIREFGGMYVDIDLQPLDNSSSSSYEYWNTIMSKNQSHHAWFFIEHVMTEEWTHFTAEHFHCRQGEPEKMIRYANFAFASTPQHPILDDILGLVKHRCQVYLLKDQKQEPESETDKQQADYEILYTTGPDIISEIVPLYLNEHKDVITVEEHNDWFYHECAGSWRNQKDKNP
jgi:mannosyltransferase OCH1-like enzyme